MSWPTNHIPYMREQVCLVQTCGARTVTVGFGIKKETVALKNKTEKLKMISFYLFLNSYFCSLMCFSMTSYRFFSSCHSFFNVTEMLTKCKSYCPSSSPHTPLHQPKQWQSWNWEKITCHCIYIKKKTQQTYQSKKNNNLSS